MSVKNLVQHPLAAVRPPSGTPRVPFEIHVSLPSTEVPVPEELLPRIEADTMIGGCPRTCASRSASGSRWLRCATACT